MDAITLTWLSTIVLLFLVPMDWYVVQAYWRAWKGGDSIRYFGPTVALLTSVAIAVTIVLVVALQILGGRLELLPVLPPGVGLLLIVLSLFLPSIGMLMLLRELRDRPPRNRRSGDAHQGRDDASDRSHL